MARNYRLAELHSEDSKLDTSLVLINEALDTVSIKCIGEKPKVILYVNPSACNVCLDSIFTFYGKVFGTDTTRFAIICFSNGSRDILVQLANNNYKYPVFYLQDSLNIPACKLETPFMFWLDDCFITKCIFIPDISHSEYTELYLEMIRRRFN